MDADTRLVRNPDVVARRLAETKGGVLLHVETGAYHRLNEVGFLVWELVDGDRRLADLGAALRAEMPGAPPELEADVHRFVESAVDRDLLRIP